MQGAFETVIFVVVGLAIVVAAIALVSNSNVYDEIGRGGMSVNEEVGRGSGASAVERVPSSPADRDEEIRQMLAARNARRARQGQAPLDVDAEIARLTAAPATADPSLAAEVRQLVVARNARRERQGKPPLDVEAEVARQLRELVTGE